MSRNEKQWLLFFGLAGIGVYLWATKSGRSLSQSAATQIETGVQRLTDLSDSTLQTIIGFESFSPRPYRDANGWSIGYGHYMGAEPTMQEISRADAYELLRSDAMTARNAVINAVGVSATQNEFDAMVSLAYNIGGSAFSNSTVARMFRAGDKQGAADAFRMWRRSMGVVSPTLVARRESERALFMA